MVKEMLTADSYLLFLSDQYGNYVVQKTLAVAEPADLEVLLQKIKPEMEDLRNISDFGIKIYNKLVKSYPCLQNKTAKSKKGNKKGNKSIQKGSKQLVGEKERGKKKGNIRYGSMAFGSPPPPSEFSDHGWRRPQPQPGDNHQYY
jgi:hypothetical protein